MKKTSYRQLSLLIFGPMMTESAAQLLFIWMVFYASIRLDLPPNQTMWIPILGASSYSLSAWIASRWVTLKHAPFLTATALGIMTALAAIAIFWPSYLVFLIIGPLFACTIGHYYVPFQMSMKAVRPCQTLAWSIAFYTISWGAGSSIGAYFGSLFISSPALVIVATFGLLLLIHTIVFVLARSARHHASIPPSTVAFISTVHHRRHAWLCFLIGGMMLRGVYVTLWPDLAKFHHWSETDRSIGSTLLVLPIALLAPIWAYFREFFREPWLMLFTMLLGLIGTLGLPWATQWPLAILCVSAIGTMMSCLVFCALYYANADPIHATRSVGISESIAGISCVFGPILLGLLAGKHAAHPLPYNIGAGLLGLTMLYTLTCRWRHGRFDAPPLHQSEHTP